MYRINYVGEISQHQYPLSSYLNWIKAMPKFKVISAPYDIVMNPVLF